MLNPTWSPDGNRIAFSALAGGLNDLFIYDLTAGALKRVTNDAFSELHPAWSPDGRTIAFSTDRFNSNLANLQTGSPKIALLDVASGTIKSLGGFDDGKNINPQWNADGRSVLFVSDRRGISNSGWSRPTAALPGSPRIRSTARSGWNSPAACGRSAARRT